MLPGVHFNNLNALNNFIHNAYAMIGLFGNFKTQFGGTLANVGYTKENWRNKMEINIKHQFEMMKHGSM